jgi:FMN phosphatase YigB (HAD superfamily)
VIRAVTFDLDDTLYDFQACMSRGAARVIEALCERHPGVAPLATVERFHQLWYEAADGTPRSYLVVADHRRLAGWVLERLDGVVEAG